MTVLNAQTKILTGKVFSSVSQRTVVAMVLVAALATVSAATAMAQAGAIVSSPTPLSRASAPGAFAAFSAAEPLDLTGIELADNAVSSSVELPDDPSALPAPAKSVEPQASGAPSAEATAGPVARLHTKYIPAGWHAQKLTVRDKVILGIRDTYNPLSFAAMLASAGYEQVLNGEPNYGVDRGAFGERLGAAGIRETTQGLFTDAVFAPLLHEDSRYYVEGSQYSLIHRIVYAATRPVITRTDNGSTSINGALLFGYAASSALTYAYYPSINQNFHDTASTFGGAVGGAALGFLVSEFSSNILTTLHLQKKQ